MRAQGYLSSGLLLSALFAGVLGAGDQLEPGNRLEGSVDQALVESKKSPQEETVMGALTEVFNSFGDIATTLYKITLTSDSSEGRGKMGKMAVPLILGFKITGAIVAALTALKVLVLKSMAMSSLALLASAGVAAKYIYDKVQSGKHADLHQTTPYYYAPIQEVAWDSSYDVATSNNDLGTSHQASTDLEGHFSSQVLQQSAGTTNQTSTYGFVPAVPVAQRKSLRGARPYKTIVYKTIHRTK